VPMFTTRTSRDETDAFGGDDRQVQLDSGQLDS